MNGDLKRFKRWAAVARQEPVPPLDVSARVLRDLVRPPRQAVVELPWVVMAGLSAAAAAVVMLWGLESWRVLTDPAAGLFEPLTLVMR